MAIHSLWDDQYAISIRRGPLDWSDQSTTGSATDAVSHTDAGVPTQNTSSNAEYGGDWDFKAARGGGGASGTLTAAVAKGQTIGMPTSNAAVIFGIPFTGNPDFGAGVEIIEAPLADGMTVGRVQGAAGSGADASNIFRGGITPTFSGEFLVNSQALMQAGAIFFQEGAGENAAHKQLKTVATTSSSDPLYVGSILRKMSASAADSRLLSDCVASSFSLSADRSTPLTCSMDFTGRLLATNINASTCADTGAADFTLDGGRNYTLQDCKVLISQGPGSTDLKHVPVDAFSLSGSAETGYTFYNQPTPQSVLTGPQSWEGSITIPYSGRGTALTGDVVQKLLAQIGASSSTPSGTTDPIQIHLLWAAAAPGIADGSTVSASTAVAAARDLHIRLHCVLTDVSVGGDSEATQTLSFRCLNHMATNTTLTTAAVSIDTKNDAAANLFGFASQAVAY